MMVVVVGGCLCKVISMSNPTYVLLGLGWVELGLWQFMIWPSTYHGRDSLHVAASSSEWHVLTVSHLLVLLVCPPLCVAQLHEDGLDHGQLVGRAECDILESCHGNLDLSSGLNWNNKKSRPTIEALSTTLPILWNNEETNKLRYNDIFISN